MKLTFSYLLYSSLVFVFYHLYIYYALEVKKKKGVMSYNGKKE